MVPKIKNKTTLSFVQQATWSLSVQKSYKLRMPPNLKAEN